MQNEIRAADAQTLLRKLYEIETGQPYSLGSLTLAQKHEIQQRYVIERSGGSYVARPKLSEAA